MGYIMKDEGRKKIKIDLEDRSTILMLTNSIPPLQVSFLAGEKCSLVVTAQPEALGCSLSIEKLLSQLWLVLTLVNNLAQSHYYDSSHVFG